MLTSAVKERTFFADGRTASGTNGRFFDVACTRNFFRNSSYFGNYVVASAYEYSVTDTDFLFEYVAVVVERRAFDRHAAYVDGFEQSKRIEFGRTGNLPYHVFENGSHLVGFELVRDCPFREFVRITDFVAQRYVVDFENDPVDKEIERLAFFVDFFRKLEGFFRVLHDAEIPFGFKPFRSQKTVNFGLR